MTALSVDHVPDNGYDWDDVVRLWGETDAPEGSKVEIIEGIVTVAPPPANAHNITADAVQELLYQAKPADCGVFQTQGVTIPGKAGLYIPDLLVMPRVVLAASHNTAPAEEALLVVEITSPSNANHDRISKAHGYARAGVPLYLLLDPWHTGKPTATLFGEPEGGTYRVLQSVEYGGVLTLPEPFELKIDTGTLPDGR
ncbi:Uma2 family endonuclease [Streptomyces sp. N2-109]|uniref:Uma2 family endonuclease n=1 Tax=Streptomyces gossypii TaxID=2883101 RepID=A0ABT2K2R6_9ACTN|nr:Uma2 family endonuclease [Streptomyces gossypii]MCT2594465.1 Uma2 family endonuclease [Streptomyces gossypii]